ncbi:chromate transporter [Trinickia dinghuensis]|uniref:Chromate transporter n=1 Tax=Trinickia dinghuensis TaxID=2291023 RepID=A0A3D8JVX3_9BURK|nr:chromate transporter [Trinickia dinghuensis]RDU96531.1 chromate transporter [Trinickia dinghuensis]
MGEASTRDRRASRDLRSRSAPTSKEEARPAPDRHAGPEPLWTLFRVVFALSALSWGGLALMAQLELHYVVRERRFTQVQYSDFVALAWMTPGAVGCGVAAQVGYALRGRIGACVAGAASVLPFFCTMTALATFYHASFIHALAAPGLIDHFAVVLAVLIGVTWYRQTRALVHAPLEWAAAAIACVVLLTMHSTASFVLLLTGSFAAGWITSPERDGKLEVSLGLTDKLLVLAVLALIALFAIPLPPELAARLIWPRLAGAGMTLFGGGFSALPVLKALFETPEVGINAREFTLAFALSPVSPGPLLNVLPFLGYLIQGWVGAVAATCSLFVPAGILIVFARRHLHRLETNARFEHGMRVLRASTTAFLLTAVVHIGEHIPHEPAHLLTAAFALVCLARLRVPVYAVYAIVAAVYGSAHLFGYA